MSNRRIRPRYLWILMLGLLCQPLAGDTPTETARILIIHSYHPSFEWTRTMHDSMVSVLDQWGGDFSLSIEYMDTKRIFTPEHLEGLRTLYEAKYRNSPPNLIIASDNNAFDFLYRHREHIFGEDIPLVFCGVNYFDPREWPDMSRTIGVDERPDLEETVQLIDRLHRTPPVIAFVNDQTVTGYAYRKGFEEWKSAREDAARFLYVDEGFPEDIIARIGRLPDDAAIVYHTYSRDPAGTHYDPEALLETLAEEYDYPMYGNYTWMFGNGIIGGPLIDSGLQGATAARLAIGVLEGYIDIDDFRLEPSPSRYFFDHRQLRKAGIRTSALPAGAVIVGKPDVIWREFPRETAFITTVLAVLTAGSIVLIRLLRRRNELVIGIQESLALHKLDERRLETVATLANLNKAEDREIMEKILRDLSEITRSSLTLGFIAEEGRTPRSWAFAAAEGTTRFRHLSEECSRNLGDRFNGGSGLVEAGSADETIRIESETVYLNRGAARVFSGDGYVLAVGMYNKETAYTDADTRQLTLLSDGLWKILTRQRSVRELDRLNRELEERVESRSIELREAEKHILRADKLATLGSLVAGIAHEVNTPLGMAVTGISHAGSVLDEMDGASDEEKADKLKTARDLITIAEAQLKRATGIMKSFKQVAVDQTGEESREFDLSELMNDVINSLKAELKRASVSISLDCPAGIVMHHYPGDLWRVFTNLVINSLKHGFTDGRQGRIEISARESGDEVYITFADDGVGIPEDLLEEVFRPFFTTARNRGGTGLGLHIIRSILEDRHGGQIWVTSPPDRGALFSLTMPRISPALVDETDR